MAKWINGTIHMTPEPDVYPPDVLAEEEPKFLRRQKPLEVRRRKFGKQQRALYLRVLIAGAVLLAVGIVGFAAADFARYSPQFKLAGPEQIEVTGIKQVMPEAVLERFSADFGRSSLRVPIEERRRALEEIPWVEKARVERVLPNRLRVEITERTPIAFLRHGGELSLIDAHGVLLEKPMQAEFEFPVVTGIDPDAPLEERERRMHLYEEFLGDIERVLPGATSYVSEVDLAEPDDLRVTLAGMPALGNPAAGGQAAVLVHFGKREFEAKFRNFVESIAHWRASAGGRVESVDLRFERQVVVNPEAQVIPPKR
jgi:cell division protein FtsQ